jgi:uncharacterized membrane protein YedE/YeeE
MIINWTQFTPVNSIIGGLMIGVAASSLAIFMGRIAGISGILSQLMLFKNAPKNHFSWRICFIFGLLSSSLIYSFFQPLPVAPDNSSISTLLIAGLLVGIGTKLGSGCTSGHGVCGLGRLSLRSLVATLTFMGSGFLSCYVFLHLIK